MSIGSRAQIGMEFFIFIGLAFLIAIAFEIAALSQLNEFSKQKEGEAVKDLALKLQKELLIAATVEDGYIRQFSAPDTLNRVNYTLTVQNSTISVQTENSFYIVRIPSVVGNVTKGANKINKTNGLIYVN